MFKKKLKKDWLEFAVKENEGVPEEAKLTGEHKFDRPFRSALPTYLQAYKSPKSWAYYISLMERSIYVYHSPYKEIMLNPIEKFKVAILHLNRAWNH